MMTFWRNRPPLLYIPAQQESQVAHHFSHWCEKSSSHPFLQEMQQEEGFCHLLRGIFAASPFLTRLLLKDMAFLNGFLQGDIEENFASILRQCDALGEDLSLGDEALFMNQLRLQRQHCALAVALTDIASMRPLGSITQMLSSFAQTAVHNCLQFIARSPLAFNQKISVSESGFIVLAMGKLGSCELNYASDIDLIFLYDDAHPLWRNRGELAHKWGQKLVHLLSTITNEGRIARVDIRLRPDDAAVVMPISAAERYYESRGRSWERAAFIKARCIAGDIKRGNDFLSYIQPFIWRRHLDFTAIEDILDLSRSYHKQTMNSLKGYNLKQHKGGIRDIELYAQCQQLIWGGRHQSLRTQGTLETLDRLADNQRIHCDKKQNLKKAYQTLRQLEHRLQMIDDSQTHNLPNQDNSYDIFAHFAGYPTSQALTQELTTLIEGVKGDTQLRNPQEKIPPSIQDITATDITDKALAWLKQQGFDEPKQAAQLIQHWHKVHYPSLSDERGRHLFHNILPTFLTMIAPHKDNYHALALFDQFLKNLPAGVQLFSLLKAHPQLLELLALIMSTAPRLAERLARRPQLLDNVLETHFDDETSCSLGALKKELKAVTNPHKDLEAALNHARIWAKDKKFQWSIHLLQNRLTMRQAAPLYSNVADGMMEKIMDAVTAPFIEHYGTMDGDGLAIIALGRLGGQTLSGASDLDIIFLYDDAKTDHHRHPPAVYYTRLVQRFITAISAPTSEGELYQLDTRLRPEGEKGALTTSLTSFTQYQKERARIWEHMALTKARVIYGSSAIHRKIDAIIHAILAQPRSEEDCRHAAHEMRARIHQTHLPHDEEEAFWSFKYRQGGMIDIDFIQQSLLLSHAHSHPSILNTSLDASLTAMAQCAIIPEDHAQSLMAASHLWRELDGVVRLCHRSGFTISKASWSLRQLLARKAGAKNEKKLIATMKKHEQKISSLYKTYILG